MDTDLRRFVIAQAESYPVALEEIRQGKKISHWMWFIFPQIKGLGESPTSKFYSIADLNEAQVYLQHPLLGPRLIEISQALLQIDHQSATKIFGSPDDAKLRSSMTLFAAADPEQPVFQMVLDKFFEGLPDTKTLEIISQA